MDLAAERQEAMDMQVDTKPPVEDPTGAATARQAAVSESEGPCSE
ncbi:hypothetical protein [Tardiphaga sp.]|nr:hypothetical protein [Tardiphaga sp.]MDB5621056.1 hypothetical protein [Tardiphaga sp.]